MKNNHRKNLKKTKNQEKKMRGLNGGFFKVKEANLSIDPLTY